jgi:dTDP-4-dehydrorhamnose reductase
LVLTYDRRDLLRNCLKAIAAQSLPCDAVLVIDNGSTDGTSEMLAAEFPWVEMCQTAKNIGAAGGFSLGMRLAVESGAEHVWVMDDDVIPDHDALERLAEAFAFLKDKGRSPPFVISTARAPLGDMTNVPEIARSRNRLDYPDWPMFLDKGLVPVQRATFVSILFPAQTFHEYGYPLASMYIWGEDSEFTERTTRNQPGFLCGQSKVVHARAAPGRLDIRSEGEPHRVRWHRHFIRNSIYVLRRHRSKEAVARYIARQLNNAVRLLLEGDLRKAGIIAGGIFAGISFSPDKNPASASVARNDIAYLSPTIQSKIEQRSVTDTSGHLSQDGESVARSKP